MTDTRKTSDKGVLLIKAHEGRRLVAYLCPAKVWTIGYGHTSAAGEPTVRQGMKITPAEADTILRRDLAMFERGVLRRVKVPLTQSQFDALVSFAFNVGLGAFERSTLLRKLNAGQHQAVPAELMKWTKGGGRELPGLVNRRRDEAALWRSISPGLTGGRGDVAVVDEPKPAKTAVTSTTNLAAAGAAAATMLNGISEAIKPAKDAIDAGKGLSDTIGSLISTPAVVLALVVAALAAWIIRERMKKMREDGV